MAQQRYNELEAYRNPQNPALSSPAKGAQESPPPPPSQDELVANWAQTQCGTSLACLYADNKKSQVAEKKGGKNWLADGTDSLSYVTGFRNYKGHWKKPEKKPSLQRFLARRHLHDNPEAGTEQITSTELEEIVERPEGKSKRRKRPKKKKKRWSPGRELKKQQKVVRRKARIDNARAEEEAMIMQIASENGTGLRQWRELQLRKQLEEKRASAGEVRQTLQKRRKGAMLQRLGSFVEKRKRVKGVYSDEKKLLVQSEKQYKPKKKRGRRKKGKNLLPPLEKAPEITTARRQTTKQEQSLLKKMMQGLSPDKRSGRGAYRCNMNKSKRMKKRQTEAEEQFLARRLAKLDKVTTAKRGDKQAVRNAIERYDEDYERAAREKKNSLRPWLYSPGGTNALMTLLNRPAADDPLSPRMAPDTRPLGSLDLVDERPGKALYEDRGQPHGGTSW